MMKSRFFLTPPFGFLVEQLIQDEDFLRDAHTIINLDQAKYSRIKHTLHSSGDFLDRDTIISKAEAILGDHSLSADIGRLIYKISGVLHSSEDSTAKAMDVLQTTIIEKAESLELDDREVLAQRLRELAATPVGLAKQAKARQLVDAIGGELDDITLICDLRPVFDADRTMIEGLIPITTVRMEYSTPEGDSAVVEVRANESQIKDISTAFETALKKLALLKTLSSSAGLPVPRTKSTVSQG